MKKKQRRMQITLVSIGLLLFVLTYLYYPNISKDKLFNKQSLEKNFTQATTEGQITAFENVEYKGLYDFDKPFNVQSEEAYILNKEPDVVYMENMHVTLYLSEGRIVKITSDFGRYNKVTYDCFFEQNVKATDGSTKIFSKNLDLLATKDTAEIYNDVYLDYVTGSLLADKIDYDFETKHFRVSMFDDTAIKMKIIQ